MPTSSSSFASELYNGLDFTNVGVLETDSDGTALSFTASYPGSFYGAETFGTAPSYDGLAWQSFLAGVAGNTSGTAESQTLQFSYDLSAAPGEQIVGLDGIVIENIVRGAGALGAVEQVYDSSNNLVASMTWTAAQGSSAQFLSAGYTDLHVVLTVTATVAGSRSSTATSAATFSGIKQGFETASFTLDKQVSVDGGNTWYDVGSGVLNDPSVLVGSTVEYRVLVTNNSGNNLTLGGAQVADSNGPGPFTFGGNPSVTVAAGSTVVSDVTTTAAVAGYNVDTATLTGSITNGTNSAQVSTSDQADYTGLTYGIALDKQISTDGSTWVDVGSGNLAQDPSVLAGSALFERVIVVNTGSVDITNAQVTDAGGNGPAGFDFGGNGTFTLAAGQTLTSDVATISAAAGYQLDTATVNGTASDSFGNSATVSATDQANYTAVTPGIALDKQISTDGNTWVDVGSGNLAQDPSVLAGSALFERVIVVNTGSVDITNAQVSDAGGNGPAGFDFGGNGTFTLAAGQTLASDVATISAASGYQLDTATVTGTASDSFGHSATVSATDQANYTAVTPGIALDKQVSTDGSTWVDVGNGNLAQDPSVLAGSALFERVIVVNTGSVDITNAQVSDAGGNGPAGFTVGGNGTFTLAAGQTLTSDVATISAAAGYQLDTAGVTGTASDSFGHSATVSATDQANYTAVTPGIALDKQVSTDGSTWVDVGNGNLAQDPSVLAGSALFERVIVVNTGSVDITNAQVSDAGGNGPAGFDFGGNGTFTLAAGQTLASDVATISAASGYQLDTATVNGTASDDFGHSTTVSATDQANYTGTAGTPDIDIAKTASATIVVAGTPVTYTYTVTNPGAVPLSNVIVTDDDATPGYSSDDFQPTFVGGDTNGNNLLDAGETWTYTATVIPPFNPSGSACGPSGSGGNDGHNGDCGPSGSSGNNGDCGPGGNGGYGGKGSDQNGGYGSNGWADGNDGQGGSNWSGGNDGHNGDCGPSGSGGNNGDCGPGGNGGYGGKGSDQNGGYGSNGWADGNDGQGGSNWSGGNDGHGGTCAPGGDDGHGGDCGSGGSPPPVCSDTDTNTAVVTGIGNGITVTASAQATVTVIPASITLDKQISTDGCTWIDVGNGNLTQDPTVLAGSQILERVIVVNTGSVAIDNAQVSDIGGNGPAGFTFSGHNTFSISAGKTLASDVATIAAGAGYQLDTATITGTETIAVHNTVSVSASDQANYTGVVPAIALDKQISTDGTNWLDVGNGNLADDPSVLVGSTLFERVIVVNTGSVVISGAKVTDAGGNGPSGFSFGGNGTFTLAAGQTLASDIATVTAAVGCQLDTATVTGTQSGMTVKATDQANYTGMAPAVTLDKQISTDGCTWIDVGNGNLAQDPSVKTGSKLYERVIVVNTGSVAIGTAQVTDVGGNGPAGFSFSGHNTFSLSAGRTLTSDVATITAATGYQLDTATVTGTETIGVHNTITVTASDQANYTGAIVFDKSTDGLSSGYWKQHQSAWDGCKDWGSSDVLYSLPNHGQSGPHGAVGVLLGDLNANGVQDNGETTLFIPLNAAQQLIDPSVFSGTDARQMLLQQAISAQLNVDNGDSAPGWTPGSAVVGADLITEAVKWLRGAAPFASYSDGSSGNADKSGMAGIIDAGTGGSIDYNTSTHKFTSAATAPSSNAWNAAVDLGLSPTDFSVSGKDLANALQAFNNNGQQLVTSSDGTLVGWSGSGIVADIHSNTAGGVWTVLKDAGIIHG